MLRILKVTGNSLSPEFNAGDYVLIATVPCVLGRLKAGDIIVFPHANYGTLIKKIQTALPEKDAFYVVGTHPSSLNNSQLGEIPRANIKGKVIWHNKSPRNQPAR